MTTPTYLLNTDSNADWAGSVEMRLRSTTSTHAIYGAWNPSTSNWWQPSDVHSIKVGTDPAATDYNIWSDNGAWDPNSVVQSTINGLEYISLYNNSVLSYIFLKPTSSNASWLSGGDSPVETLVKSINRSYIRNLNVIDPKAWYAYWWSVDGQNDDRVSINVTNAVNVALSNLVLKVKDKASEVVTTLQNAVVARDPDDSDEVTIDADVPPEDVSGGVFVVVDTTDGNDDIVGEFDFGSIVRKGSLNFW